MTGPLELHEQVAMLAARIVDCRDRILTRWREAVMADSRVEAADSMSRVQFEDHIPAVLRALHDAIVDRSGHSDTRHAELAQGHGVHRWQQGYALLEVIREWSHLQVALLAEIEQAAEDQGFDVRAVNAAHRAVARLCLEAMTSSVEEFERLQRAEAQGQLVDLGQSLGVLGELERRQAELLRGVAHDLRGHMGIVSSATAALGHPSELSAAQREELFAMAQRAIHGQRVLLSDLMDLARLQAGLERRTVAKVDASRTLNELCSTMGPMASAAGLYLHCEGPAHLWVESDVAKIARIVQNLVLNALHYTTAGGVTVQWGDSAPDDPHRWKVTVIDTGPGIATDAGGPLSEAIQDATEQARDAGDTTASHPAAAVHHADLAPSAPARHGEGIGLSIVKRLCQILDATLAMDSEPSRGTAFTIVLPRRYSSETDQSVR